MSGIDITQNGFMGTITVGSCKFPWLTQILDKPFSFLFFMAVGTFKHRPSSLNSVSVSSIKYSLNSTGELFSLWSIKGFDSQGQLS